MSSNQRSQRDFNDEARTNSDALIVLEELDHAGASVVSGSRETSGRRLTNNNTTTGMITEIERQQTDAFVRQHSQHILRLTTRSGSSHANSVGGLRTVGSSDEDGEGTGAPLWNDGAAGGVGHGDAASVNPASRDSVTVADSTVTSGSSYVANDHDGGGDAAMLVVPQSSESQFSKQTGGRGGMRRTTASTTTSAKENQQNADYQLKRRMMASTVVGGGTTNHPNPKLARSSDAKNANHSPRSPTNRVTRPFKNQHDRDLKLTQQRQQPATAAYHGSRDSDAMNAKLSHYLRIDDDDTTTTNTGNNTNSHSHHGRTPLEQNAALATMKAQAESKAQYHEDGGNNNNSTNNDNNGVSSKMAASMVGAIRISGINNGDNNDGPHLDIDDGDNNTMMPDSTAIPSNAVASSEPGTTSSNINTNQLSGTMNHGVQHNEPPGELSIANAVATEDLEAQIRDNIISGAVQATEVAAIPEGDGTEMDASVRLASKNDRHGSGGDGDRNTSNTNDSKNRKYIILAVSGVCLVVVVAVVIIVALLVTGGGSGSSSSSNANDNAPAASQPPVEVTTTTPTTAPTIDDPKKLLPRHFLFLDWLKSATLDATVLEDETSPQYRAFQWLALDSISSRDEIPDNTQFVKTARLLERYAMACIFYSTKGDTDWLTTGNWLTDDDICIWMKASCNGNGRLIGLDLSENNLRGSIPPELGLLNQLESFHFGKNPYESSTANLRTRELQTGDNLPPGLPTTIGLLVNLEELRISRSGVGGTIPTEIGKMTRLKKIFGKESEISGPIPSEMGLLANLVEIDVPKNDLSGQLPSELGQLQKLNKIDFSENNFTGSIPIEFTAWPPGIQWIILEDNNFDIDAIESTFCTIANPTSQLEFECNRCTCCSQCA